MFLLPLILLFLIVFVLGHPILMFLGHMVFHPLFFFAEVLGVILIFHVLKLIADRYIVAKSTK